MNCGCEEAFAGWGGVNTAWVNRRVRLTRVKLLDDLLATYGSPRAAVSRRRENLTPDSPDRVIVLEQMPDQASQKRISWSYEPVTRMTDMSCAACPGDLLAITGAGMGGGRGGRVFAGSGTLPHLLSGTVYHQTTTTLFLP